MSECTNGETSETACGFVVEFADIINGYKMNANSTNVGGWKNSELRIYINGDVFSALPSELQNVITKTKVISGHGSTSGETNFETQDKLYLFSRKEIWGESNGETLFQETKQLDYYKNQGMTLEKYDGAIKKMNLTETWWWLRSSYSDNNISFLTVGSNGHYDIANSSYTGGVSPAFRMA